jgi:hypothetical protein
MKNQWVQTYTGRAFDLVEPRPSMISIVDITQALSQLCRYTGHTNTFYSVAEHSIHCSQIVPEPLARYAMLHDAAEAYIGDISYPMKQLLGPLVKPIEAKIERVIFESFGLVPIEDLPLADQQAIKHADLQMLKIEREELLGRQVDGIDLEWPLLEGIPLPNVRLALWNHLEAKMMWTSRFNYLFFT